MDHDPSPTRTGGRHSGGGGNSTGNCDSQSEPESRWQASARARRLSGRCETALRAGVALEYRISTRRRRLVGAASRCIKPDSQRLHTALRFAAVSCPDRGPELAEQQLRASRGPSGRKARSCGSLRSSFMSPAARSGPGSPEERCGDATAGASKSQPVPGIGGAEGEAHRRPRFRLAGRPLSRYHAGWA